MIKSTMIVNLIIICIITAMFGYLLGLAVVKVVDYRLSNISITLPKGSYLPYTEESFEIYEGPQSSKPSDMYVYEPFTQDPQPSAPKPAVPTPATAPKPLAPAPAPKPTVPTPAPKPTVPTPAPAPKPTVPTPVPKPTVPTPAPKPLAPAPAPKTTVPAPATTPKPLASAPAPKTAVPAAAPKPTTPTPTSVKKVPQKVPAKPVVPAPKTTLIARPPTPRPRVTRPSDYDSDIIYVGTPPVLGHTVDYRVGCNTDNDCNLVYGQGQNKCLVDHNCYCTKGSGTFCQNGPTYYKDPKDMTPEQLFKFKHRSKIYKMTLQDYMNWLILFDNEPDTLPPRHFANLLKLRKGEPLTLTDLPKDDQPTPLTAQEYFDKITAFDTQLMPQNLDTAGAQLPANYSDYSQFETPRNLKHLDDFNHQEKLYKYKNRDTIDQTRPKISHEWDN